MRKELFRQNIMLTRQEARTLDICTGGRDEEAKTNIQKEQIANLFASHNGYDKYEYGFCCIKRLCGCQSGNS